MGALDQLSRRHQEPKYDSSRFAHIYIFGYLEVWSDCWLYHSLRQIHHVDKHKQWSVGFYEMLDPRFLCVYIHSTHNEDIFNSSQSYILRHH